MNYDFYIYNKTSINEHLYKMNTSYLHACLSPPMDFCSK